MDPIELAVLGVAALLTSILSAIVGMAGGITLLSVMLLFLEPLAAIPLHGVVQLVSNSSRALIQRKHVERGILARYAILLLPMGFAGVTFARSLTPETAKRRRHLMRRRLRRHACRGVPRRPGPLRRTCERL